MALDLPLLWLLGIGDIPGRPSVGVDLSLHQPFGTDRFPPHTALQVILRPGKSHFAVQQKCSTGSALGAWGSA